MQEKNVRRIALLLLARREEAGQYTNLTISSAETASLSDSDKRLLTALVYTTTEQRLRYDYLIGAISKREVSSLEPTVRLILELGICQILDMNGIPAYAAINETVSLGRHKGERSFINGVLREIDRQKDALPMPKREKNIKRYLSIAYSFPAPLVAHFLSLYGESVTEKLLSFFNTTRYTDITVNMNKCSPDKLVKLLSEALPDMIITKDRDTDMGIRIDGSVNVRPIRGFSDGSFIVQDKASLVCCEALSAEPGNTVVDVCSAPGGKSFVASMKVGESGKVYSFDLHESKLGLISGGAERLGLNNITVASHDARTPDSSLLGKADRVICDVPCSGLGVLGKKPDLRYKDLTALTELPELQLEILKASSTYLKAGGIITYSTCTLNPLENEEVVKAFLKDNPDFVTEDFTVGSLSSVDGALTLRPDLSLSDGFFVARLRKVK